MFAWWQQIANKRCTYKRDYTIIKRYRFSVIPLCPNIIRHRAIKGLQPQTFPSSLLLKQRRNICFLWANDVQHFFRKTSEILVKNCRYWHWHSWFFCFCTLKLYMYHVSSPTLTTTIIRGSLSFRKRAKKWILVLLHSLSLLAEISHSVRVVELGKRIPLLVSCLVEQKKKKM